MNRKPRIFAHTWTLFPVMGPVEAARFAAAESFQGLELNCNALDFWPGMVPAAMVRELTAIRGGEGIEYSFYSPSTLNPATSLSDLQALNAETFRRTLDLASTLGCRIICTHPGTVDEIGLLGRKGVPFVTDRYDRDALARDGAARAVDTIRGWADLAGRAGITVVVENEVHTTNTAAPTAQALAAMITAVGRANVKANFDTGHAFIGAGLIEEFTVLKPHIGHFHMDDNRERISEHLVLGEGAVDFPAIADFLAATDAALVLEIYAPARPVEATLKSRDYLLHLLASVDAAVGRPR